MSHSNIKSALEIIELNREKKTQTRLEFLEPLISTVLDPKKLDQLSGDVFYWVYLDFYQKTAYDDQILKSILFHEGLKTFSEQPSHLPELYEQSNRLALTLRVPLNRDQSQFQTAIIVLTTQYCFVISHGDLEILEPFYKGLEKNMLYARTPCSMFFLMLDYLLEAYAHSVIYSEVDIEDLEDKISESPEQSTQLIMNLKKQTMFVRQNLIAIQHILIRLTSKKTMVISDACQSSLFNLLNNLTLIVSETDSIRELLKSYLTQIDNIFMQELNKTMKILTGFSAILLPLNFVTSLYGMNFKWMPELEWQYGYPIVLCGLLFGGIGLFTLFRRKKWL